MAKIFKRLLRVYYGWRYSYCFKHQCNRDWEISLFSTICYLCWNDKNHRSELRTAATLARRQARINRLKDI